MDKNNFTFNGLNDLNDDEFNLDLNNNDEDDLLLLKVKEPPSQSLKLTTGQTQLNNNKIQLNNDEDEEDEIIKSQALFEATNNPNKISFDSRSIKESVNNTEYNFNIQINAIFVILLK
jgi:hypothetical protein